MILLPLAGCRAAATQRRCARRAHDVFRRRRYAAPHAVYMARVHALPPTLLPAARRRASAAFIIMISLAAPAQARQRERRCQRADVEACCRRGAGGRFALRMRYATRCHFRVLRLQQRLRYALRSTKHGEAKQPAYTVLPARWRKSATQPRFATADMLC